MTRRKRGSIRRLYIKSHYELSEVLQRINNNQLLIKPEAQDDAYRLFGWGLPDIKNAYRKLKERHCCNTALSLNVPGVYLDFYKATIKGEKIYTHFYIDYHDNLLVINSFHEP